MGGLILLGCGIAVAGLAIFADAVSGWIVHHARIRAALNAIRDGRS